MKGTHIQIFFGIAAVFFSSGCGDDKVKDYAGDEGRFSGQKFREHIRSTDACTPAEERAGFVLPEGFEIELFASEPDIGKPINLTFDAKGRVWVTQSYEYPFPAKRTACFG